MFVEKNLERNLLIIVFGFILVFSFNNVVFAKSPLFGYFETIELDGAPVKIHYYHTPPKDPSLPYKTLIFFHGMPVSNAIWPPVMARLYNLTNVESYAISFPGFGKSDTPAPESFDYTETGLNRVPFKFADKLGIERFIPVVHDLGGVWTICPSVEHMERLDGLVAMNTPPPSSPDLPFYPVPAVRILGSLMAEPEIPTFIIKKYIRDALQAATTRDVVDRFPIIVNEIVQDNSDNPHRLAISTIIQEAMDSPVGFGGICYQYFAALNILKPLLIWGMDDTIEGGIALSIFQEAWPDAQTVEVSNAHHFVMLDQVQIVASAIANYVNQQLNLAPNAPAIRPIGKLPAVWADIKSNVLEK